MPTMQSRDDRKKRIIIEDGLVKIEELRITKTMDLEKFNENLQKKIIKATPILSTNTIFYKCTEQAQLAIIELQPGIRKLQYSLRTGSVRSGGVADHKGKGVATYRLSFPYIYFAILFNDQGAVSSVSAVVSKSAINKMSDIVSAAPIPNLGSYSTVGSFCLGNIRVPVIKNNEAFRKTTEELVNSLLMSKFNSDLSMYIPKEIAAAAKNRVFKINGIDKKCIRLSKTTMHPSGFNMNVIPLFFELWEEASLKDDFIALQWSYLKLGTFQEYVDTLMSDNNGTFGFYVGESLPWI